MPRCEILRAPVAAGKTQQLIDDVLKLKKDSPLAPVWVLLPDQTHQRVYRRRLAEQQTPGAVVLQLETYHFDTLQKQILALAGDAQRQLSPPMRRALIGFTLGEMKSAGQLRHFSDIASKAGFIEQLLQFFDELKQQRISTAVFHTVAATEKDEELARIYGRYQEYLRQERLVDGPGAGWLALAHLQSGRAELPEIALFQVDGFDQFTPLQAAIIAALTKRAKRTTITLPGLDEEAESRTDTRVSRYETARERINEALADADIQPTVIGLRSPSINKRPASLRHLAEQLFRLSPLEAENDGCIQFIEAPGPAQEVRAVLREIKKRLVVDGVPPEDIAIVLAAEDRYLSYVKQIAREFQIPIQLDPGQPLLDNPAVDALLRCARLAEARFALSELLDVLRSPYTRPPDFDDELLAHLKQLSQRYVSENNIAGWLRQWESLFPVQEQNEAENELARRAQSALKHFLQALNISQHLRWREYVDWLLNCFGLDEQKADGYIHLLAQTQGMEGDDEREKTLKHRDRLALTQLIIHLRQFHAMSNLFASVKGRANWQPQQELRMALKDLHMRARDANQAAVLVTTVYRTRALAPAHAYLLGLGEGLFPPPAAETPFYLSSEREALRERGLKLRREVESHQHDGIFFQLAASARETLTLSRPHSNAGQHWPASPFWQATQSCFTEQSVNDHLQRIATGESPALAEIASTNEALAALVADERAVNGRAALAPWLYEHPDQEQLLGRIQRAADTENARLSPAPHNQYSGVLAATELRADIAARLHDEYPWSAGQLDEFNRCGFHFFARRLLEIEPFARETETATLYGSLTHEILQLTYEPFRLHKIAIEPLQLGRAIDHFYRVMERIFTEGQSGYISLQQRRMPALLAPIRGYISEQLQALIEKDFSAESPFHKIADGATRTIHDLEQQFDRRIPLGNDQPGSIRLTGKIDRIDRVGDHFIIVDYKSGSRVVSPKEMVEGRELQLPLYLLASQVDRHLLPAESRFSAFFWHTRHLKQSKVITDQDDALLNAVRQRVREMVNDARNANFRVNPHNPEEGRCVRYCPYFELCRLSRTNQRKSA